MKEFFKPFAIGIYFLIIMFTLAAYWQPLKLEVYGGIGVVSYLAGFFFAIIGHYLSILYSIGVRNIKSTNTPVDFDIEFFNKKNSDRLWLTLFFAILFTFTAFRFWPEIFNGKEFTMWGGLVTGFSPDRVFRLLTKGLGDYVKPVIGNKD